jgi:hypothetical protein
MDDSIFWTFLWYDLLFGNLVNYYLNRLKITYLNSLNDWFNFLYFFEYNYIFNELKVLLIVIILIIIEFLLIYPVYFETYDKIFYFKKRSPDLFLFFNHNICETNITI